jgi:hypothetical protein
LWLKNVCQLPAKYRETFSQGENNKLMNQYQLTDPITKGTWIINSTTPLSEFGVQYAALDASLRDDVRPEPNGTVTVNFSFKTGDQMSESQKLLEALLTRQ